jgi:hypothetical protein
MLGEPLWYWLALALAALAWLIIPAFHYWEQRQDRRDAELWERIHGGDVWSRRVP